MHILAIGAELIIVASGIEIIIDCKFTPTFDPRMLQN